ncbi:N-acetylmuramoyl-L-alanine amidase [Oceanomicrobium pacificus]|uniref:N-acetylmuramoyl-L-alanine amidase n=1 Tax=Oceanomicrobium pacificus TaxID=2692916 RepID=A0A6B0TW49_9RHOB|nr:N-acetylmuramoyl-L-alanine amidase [Oceanomicrobium pacificus]MXU65788.1 AMIN domain-containing protein [Oceanomicrobium pacificus]
MDRAVRAAALAAAVIFSVAGGSPARAQSDLRAVADVVPSRSGVEEHLGGDISLRLSLDRAVPFRVFTLDAPRRMVLDFREVDWSAMDPRLGEETDLISDLRYGIYRPGWSRAVIDLTRPMAVRSAILSPVGTAGAVDLDIRLTGTDAAGFAATAGHPGGGIWEEAVTLSRPERAEAGRARPLIAIDPGHGGIDPGAVRGEVTEKDVTLSMGRILAETLQRSGRYDVLLTRDADYFLTLSERVEMAREAGAIMFLSLHANTVEVGIARGATIFTLSEDPLDAESEELAALENRVDVLAGTAIDGTRDSLAQVLVDLARVETQARSEQFATDMVAALDPRIDLNRSKPKWSANFRVLRAPDMPSVLLEMGFLSDEIDRSKMLSVAWQEAVAEGIVAALDAWIVKDRKRAELARQ